MGLNNRGIALILTMWIMLALILIAAGIAMMARTETQIARNTADVNRCKWAARAGIYAATNQLQTLVKDPATYLTEEPYTISSDDLNLDLGGYAFQAIVQDEAGKVNLNTATSETLTTLFGDTNIAEYIVAWRTPITASSNQSTGTDYYSTLDPAYKCKNAAFETVNEIGLVEGITADMLSSPPPSLENANHSLIDLLTVYTPKTPRQSTSGTKVDIQSGNNQALGRIFTTQEVSAIIDYRTRRRFASPAEIIRVSGISREKIAEVYEQLTVSGSTAHTGLVNINTAPLEVLAVQPGFDASMAQAVIDYRTANGAFSGVGRLLAASEVSADAFVNAAPYFTVNSNVFKIVSTGQLASTKTAVTITSVVEIGSDGQVTTRYWQE